MAIAALAVIAASSVFLFVYGVNLLYLSWRALRLPPLDSTAIASTAAEAVVVQLPIYNERYVATRVIDACALLSWPRDRLEIQVLDDSDDDTPEIVAGAVSRWRRAGLRITHVRRGSRAGYKAGALAHGLTLTSARLVAVFDADFVPGPSFLRQMVPLLADPRVGFVQARWGHLNRDFSLLTHLQALMVDFHFLVEQAVRARSGYLMNFTGSAGVWRRAAIADAGCWSARTLTEDLDLSYRAQLRGWRAAYLEDVVVPQELPVSVNAYRGQQSRWATGSFQCAARLLVPVLRSGLRPAVKFQAAMHLLGYAAPVAMLVQVACYPVLLAAIAGGHPLPGVRLPLAASALSLAPAVGMAVAQSRRGREWWRQGLGMLCWSVLGAGTSLAVAASLWRALRGGGEFERTPKYRIEHFGQDWRRLAYFKRGDPGAVYELGFGVAAGALTLRALAYGQPLLAIYAGLFSAGFLYLALASFVQGLSMIRYEAVVPHMRGWARSLQGPALLAAMGLVLLAFAQLPDPFEDSYQHWLIAANLAATGRLQDPLFQMQDTWLPAYHVLAALVLRGFGIWQLGALKLVNAALGLATLALTYRLAETRRQGLLAVALLGLNPIFLLTATSVVAEPLLVVFLLAALRVVTAGRRLELAAVFAGLACLTGTKAWLWLGCVCVVLLAEALRRRRRALPRLAWAAPALALAFALQAVFGFASHSLARGVQEAGSAAARGSLPGSPLVRLGQFTGFFAIASPLLVGLAPLGLAPAVRGRTRLLPLVYVPSLLYLVVVTALVCAGVYSGSHRYYYPALPGLALLAAGAAARLRMPAALLPVGAAAAVAVGFVPVLTGLAADNRGLRAAGVSVAGQPGALLTDSPAAAYWSHKPPGAIYGSRALPAGQGTVLPWLRSRGVRSLVLEEIDYYRASAVLPGLVAGRPAPPFLFLGDQSAYTVPGGKRVHAYTVGRPSQTLAGGLTLSVDQGAWPARGKTSGLGKGPVLVAGGQDLAGGGLGFGVPLAQFEDGWWFPGPDSTLSVGAGGRTWVRTYDLDRREVDSPDGHFIRFEAGPSHGQVRVTYVPQASGDVGVEVRALHLGPGLQQVVVANEESAAFDDYADAAGPFPVGSWSRVHGDWGRLHSSSLGAEWEVPAPPRPASFFGARERRGPAIDFSGLEWVFPSGFTGVDYTVSIRRAR